jgi:UDP-N-acetylglucosamine 2-epimerase (non-hydrolysing)
LDVPRVLVSVGTRPEAVKVAPVITALRGSALEPVVIATAQHRELLDQVLEVFAIAPEEDFDILRAGQTPDEILARILERFPPVLARWRPDLVLVQGDTTAVLAAALAGFHADVPVVHLEAGLRTGDLRAPWPEEMNRRLVSHLASLHLAPTTTAVENLLHEGIRRAQVVLTGNTVVDALQAIVDRELPWREPALAALDHDDRHVVLVTVHRRESWGEPMERIARALATIAERRPNVRLVLPLHPNPRVREIITAALEGFESCLLLPPLVYTDVVRLLSRSRLVLTDSGGLQEEAPSVGTPVLVLRDVTERPEGVAAGAARLVGTDPDAIVRETLRLLDDDGAHASMSAHRSIYGDGHAAERAVAAMLNVLGLGPPADELSEPR